MGQFIGDALNSVGRQTHKTWEALVVDDAGPDDGTNQIVTEFQRRYPEHRIEFVRHERNSGVSAARNTAIKLSRGYYLAFLDPDDLWANDYLEKQLDTFRSCPDVTVSYTNALFIDIHGNRLNKFLGPKASELENLGNSLCKRNFINPSATVLKREAVINIGFFDESPDLQFVEDWDLWLRMHFQGYNFKFNHLATSFYRKHDNAASHQPERFAALKRALREKHLTYPEYRRCFIEYVEKVELERNSLFQKLYRIKTHAVISRLIATWKMLINRNFDVLD
jgi:glycosyltransferase involved in cell wall biosynthesis